MKKLMVLGFFVFTLLTSTMIHNTSHASDNLTDLQKANIIFNWLESEVPQILFPTPQQTLHADNIYARFYPGLDVAIGTIGSDLYYLDHTGVLHNLGAVEVCLELVRESDPRPTPPPEGKTWTDPVTGMDFVWVPGGCFDRGCGDWDGECCDSELPVREVCLDGFWMGKYEVTQGQWTQIMGSNSSNFQSGDNYPVEQVSWYDTQDFIAELNSQGFSTFRLPTEAEWEYAARSGGREEKYAGGDDLDNLSWYSGNSGMETHEVGTKAANGLGIYDMSGNVSEWVSDWYESNYYSESPQDNPQGPETGSFRVLRGGSWYELAPYCRAAYRFYSSPDYRESGIGFRLALSPGQE